MCTHFAIIQETENNSEKGGEGGVRSIVFWLVINNNNSPEVFICKTP